MIEQKTVVVLLSDKRSGSTMLQREICKHPEIRTVDYSPHTYLETHHWLKAAVLLGLPRESFAGQKVYRGYGSRQNAKTYLLDCVTRNVPEFAVPVDDRELVFEGWEALCRRFALPVFFEKSPQVLAQWGALSLLLEWIRKTDFRVKIIGLTRNPMAVQYSANRLFHTDPEKRQFGWMETQKNLLAIEKLLPGGSYLHTRYEDVIRNPGKALEQIFEFLEVARLPGAGAEIHDHSLTGWKDDPFFTFRLCGPVKQFAMAFGYSADDLENPAKPEPPFSYRLNRGLARVVRLGRARMISRILKPVWLRVRGR